MDKNLLLTTCHLWNIRLNSFKILKTEKMEPIMVKL